MLSIFPNPLEHEPKGKKSKEFFEILENQVNANIIPFSSARAAMVYGLSALGLTRMDEILVPPFLSHCVLSALNKSSFPALVPSSRTKAILVYHQFGFPQKIEEIERYAKENNWIIVNNCVNTIFSKINNDWIINWGDFTVLSFPKLYPCNLGGGFLCQKIALERMVSERNSMMKVSQIKQIEKAFDSLLKAKKNPTGSAEILEVDAVYGYLPSLASFPAQAFDFLPNSKDEIVEDIDHRKKILKIVQSFFPLEIEDKELSGIVPFAIPIRVDEDLLELVAKRIKEEFEVEVPVLHFDFAYNILNPLYKKALIIGCHRNWTTLLVENICRFIKEQI